MAAVAKETRLLTTWKLSPTNTARYLRMIECGYKSNPYHNAIHAADVLQTMHGELSWHWLGADTQS